MMNEHCIIDGERCSKCCEVLTIRESKSFREWRAYVRRYGYPTDNEKYPASHNIYDMLRKISKRRAKKVNPNLVKRIGNDQSYWTCRYYTGSGCGNYENRPYMCSGYPYYGRTEQEWRESPEYKAGGLYHIKCTFYGGCE